MGYLLLLEDWILLLLLRHLLDSEKKLQDKVAWIASNGSMVTFQKCDMPRFVFVQMSRTTQTSLILSMIGPEVCMGSSQRTYTYRCPQTPWIFCDTHPLC